MGFKTTVKTKADELLDFASHLEDATQDPSQWDVNGLLNDARWHVLSLNRILAEKPRLLKEIRLVATIIGEFAGPTNIIAADLFERLRKIESCLLEWPGEESTT